MQLSPKLRGLIEAHLERIPLKELQQAAASLSERYRAENPAKSAHLSSNLLASAYLAVRFPATFAAVRRAMSEVAQVLPAFAPEMQMDAGSGPGTALLAAKEVWPGINQALLLEGSGPIQQAGIPLVESTGVTVEWRALDLAGTSFPGKYDLVTCAYVLSELEEGTRGKVVEALWAATGEVLLLVEPGTPAGWKRILDARTVLLSAGAHVIAPCAHSMACPLSSPDWCHFAERVERGRMHRLVKQGDVPWEDEKFLYLAVSRSIPPASGSSRVLMPSLIGHGTVTVKLCQPDGTATTQRVRKRDERYKAARRADWGDRLPLA